MSTHNICFRGEIREIFRLKKSALSVAMLSRTRVTQFLHFLSGFIIPWKTTHLRHSAYPKLTVNVLKFQITFLA